MKYFTTKMVDLNDAKFSRWTFSLEASELNNEFNLSQNNDSCVLPEAWDLLMQHVSFNENRTETSTEDTECLTDSSVSTDVDEEEWEDLRVYMKECKKWKETSYGAHVSSPAGSVRDLETQNSKKLAELSIDGDKINDNKVSAAALKKIRNRQPYNYNVFSQIIYTQDINQPEEKQTETDVISMLKDAVTKDDLVAEEIAELLRSSDVTKKHIIDMWTELESIDARLRLSSVMADYKLRIVFLCQKLLFPWLSNGDTKYLNDVIRKVSAVLPKFSDMAIKHLISPLILSDNTSNSFIKDTYLIQDLMSHLGTKHWMLLLQDLLTSSTKLENHHIPLLKFVIESGGDLVISDPDTLYRVFGIINLLMNDCSKDRDFGLLITTIIDCVAKAVEIDPNIIKSLKDITDNYKGPMRFKIANLMKQFNK